MSRLSEARVTHQPCAASKPTQWSLSVSVCLSLSLCHTPRRPEMELLCQDAPVEVFLASLECRV